MSSLPQRLTQAFEFHTSLKPELEFTAFSGVLLLIPIFSETFQWYVRHGERVLLRIMFYGTDGITFRTSSDVPGFFRQFHLQSNFRK
jgi:hypothetical protein